MTRLWRRLNNWVTDTVEEAVDASLMRMHGPGKGFHCTRCGLTWPCPTWVESSNDRAERRAS